MYEVPIRRLRVFDKAQVVLHFNNLNPETLLSRFGTPIQPDRLQTYIDTMFDTAAIVFGAFPDSQLRGVGELRRLPESRNQIAEAAFTVEEPWQDKGIGDALLSRIITAAQNRGIREVHMLCLATNQKMRRLALRHKAELDLVPGQIEATLTTLWPTPFSLVEELSGEYHAFAKAILRGPGAARDPD